MMAIRNVLSDMPERIRNLESEMIGWDLGGRPDLLPVNEDDGMDNEMGPADLWDIWGFQGYRRHLSSIRRMKRVSLSLSWSPSPEKSKPRAKKSLPVLKRAMSTKKASGWSSKGWQNHAGWKQAPAFPRSQSSQEQWTQPAQTSKWKGISKVLWELGTLIK